MLSDPQWASQTEPNVEFAWLYPDEFASNIFTECAQLYSEHYGKWAEQGIHPGQPIKLSAKRLQEEWLAHPNSRIAIAKTHNNIVGYAFAIQIQIPEKGLISWVTQLVVHAEYRQKGIAKRLLNGIWSFSNHYAWGLVTANPYAVRALEKATRRRCEPEFIQNMGNLVLDAGREVIEYVKEATPKFKQSLSIVDTSFYVDTSEFSLTQNPDTERDWKLGNLQPGQEWFAFTFREQNEIALPSQELETVLADADKIVQSAYAGMTLDSNHIWKRYTDPEVEYLFGLQAVQPGYNVLDFGCSSGRHAIKLAQRGCNVTGVDFIETLVKQARSQAQQLNIDSQLQFLSGDCRNINLEREFDTVICLYDVIGTFPDESENIKILENLVRHLKVGGHALISVLNYQPTLDRAKYIVDLSESTKTLLDLPPSKTMQDSGQIFDPDYYLIDRVTNVVYRKEQFDLPGTSLPRELVVRDRRYLRDRLMQMCSDAGLEMVFCKPVQAGKWSDPPLEESSLKAKELLYYGKKLKMGA
jgi:2-polyprenyl-3-methyl-5-hydroxy-6-metoxy-1,4-benzoquinol methylase/GNAT superfamily N-acetyltransferase